MRLFLLGLFFLTAQTTTLRAQEKTPLDWSTSIIQRIPGRDHVRVTAETVSVDVSKPEGVSAAQQTPSGAQKRRADTGTEEGTPRRSDAAPLKRLRDALGSGTALRVTRLYALPESLIIEPPEYALEESPNWDRLFADDGTRRITRVPVDDWPTPAIYGLMLARGGLYLDGAGSDTTAAIAAFRLRHPSVARGDHEPLINSAYSFRRSLSERGRDDQVVIVLGAKGKASVNVSRAFADDALLRDAMTGQTAFVSFGMARFDAHPSGVILIEELR